MTDAMVSQIDGSLLLPIEQITPDNISLLQGYSSNITSVLNYMTTVRTAVFNYQKGFSSKIVLNPADIQTNIAAIRAITVRIGGGFDTDGVTVIAPLAANLLPDLLMSLRDSQLWLCRLYGLYQDSQGTLVGPLDSVAIEDTTNGGDAV